MKLRALLLLASALPRLAFAADHEYREARVYVTAPAEAAAPYAPGAYPAPKAAAEELLADHGFCAFAPLPNLDEHIPTIMIDDKHTFQTIVGFGAAFTDSAADVFGKLPAEAQERLIKACFGTDPATSNCYTLCRTTIHSCDFAAEPYSYDDTPGDKELTHFSIEHDKKNRIPMIQRAIKASGGELKIFASPWSPPGWMKTNGSMIDGGKLKPDCYQAWADYFVKYIQAYAAEKIPIWGVTVQNEALATQTWESCIYTPEEERDFVKNNLGPALHKAGLGDVKVMIWDHNRGLIYERVQPAYDDPEASKYIWGAAYPWYVGDHFDNVRQVHDAFPDKHLLYSESGISSNWESAEKLSRSVIMDLNNWAEGWSVWNLVLDQENGPRDAGIAPGIGGSTIVNGNTDTGELSYHPAHYAFGQFTRFIRPGAKRIACTSTEDDLIATAFLNPDGKIAVVVLNMEDHPMFTRIWRAGQFVKYTIPGNGTVTFVMQPI
ncbi:MAG TPA: glycoside hydrolase family 30 protein [Chthoniobacteraceae bacterium]|nr:glycoside hydrolase family 30 protein [Chthoniobacteraceae bacterium]